MTRPALLAVAAIVTAGIGVGTSGGGSLPPVEIVYESDGAIYVTSSSSSAGTPITDRRHDDSNPAWSPDLGRIAFVRQGRIWVMESSGKRLRRVTRGRFDTEPDWAPDGRTLVYRGNSPNSGTFDLYLVRLDGTGLRNLTGNEDDVSVTAPAWSPGGGRIAFQRTHYEVPSDTGVFTIGSDGRRLKRIVLAGHSPTWSRDSKRLAYMLNGFAGWQIFVTPGVGGATQPLTPTGSNTDPAWCRDGRHITFVRDGRIAVMNADGTGVRILPKPTPKSLVGNPDC